VALPIGIKRKPAQAGKGGKDQPTIKQKAKKKKRNKVE